MVAFDRSATEAPKGLYVLRNVGHWRWFNSCGWTGNNPAPSTGMSMAWRYKKSGVFLDAGCGHSPDAAVAVRWGFKSAIKVDLWEPYWREMGCVSFRDRLEQIDGPKVRFIQGDICKLTDYVEPNSVDLINCHAVVDLLSADDRHLFYCEAYDALREGGVLAVTHLPLALGHRDWVHGRDEFGRIANDGYAAFECLRASKSILVLRKEAE